MEAMQRALVSLATTGRAWSLLLRVLSPCQVFIYK